MHFTVVFAVPCLLIARNDFSLLLILLEIMDTIYNECTVILVDRNRMWVKVK